jgi:ectoine hydroxylase-related dioxygenase (phytanoyl-CoA dioxygenase family)
MRELTRLPANATTDEILKVIAEDGAVILEHVLDAAEVARVKDEIMPYVDATKPGRDAFTGFHTTRTGALVARSPACRRLVMNATVLEAARKFLEPFCAHIQLHLTQVIRIRPGQEAQHIHRDRWAWGTYLQGIEPQFNTIWAISRFTKENGATRVAPGSVDWPDDRRPGEDEIVQAVMDPGSVILYTGSVFHGGGANTSSEDRIGLNLTYSLAWLRQEENQYLSCPPEIAKDLEPDLQALLGYTIGSYALGYYTPPLAAGEGPELVGPEYALGSRTGGEDAYSQFGAAELYEKISADTAGPR